MKWPYSYIPVLGEHLLTFLECPTPVAIGINSEIVTFDGAILANPNATILDIDSNILHNATESILCDCAKARISKQIQLAKAYYYVDRERLNSFRMTSLEENIGDKLFVKTAQKLLKPIDDGERDQIFVNLIRHAFFNEFLIGFEKLSESIVFNPITKKSDFIKEKLVKTVKECSNCSMKNF